MIKLIHVPFPDGDEIWVSENDISRLYKTTEKEKTQHYLVLREEGFDITEETYKAILAEFQGKSEILSELALTTITTIERGETTTNQRPMWRCVTDDKQKVNIFLNTDEKEKDNFHLFAAAGWGEKLQEMALYSAIDQDIQIAMKKVGHFWEVVLVRPYSQHDYPF